MSLLRRLIEFIVPNVKTRLAMLSTRNVLVLVWVKSRRLVARDAWVSRGRCRILPATALHRQDLDLTGVADSESFSIDQLLYMSVSHLVQPSGFFARVLETFELCGGTRIYCLNLSGSSDWNRVKPIAIHSRIIEPLIV